MNQPLVSVIIPVYKGEQYLEKTVKSILAQSYTNFEIILINDGSPDNSLEVMEKLSAEDSRIKTFDNKNGGVAFARNYGVNHSKGEFIAFCDQDDLWMPTKLSKQIPLFEDEEVGLVYCGAIAEYIEQGKSNAPDFSDKEKGKVFDRLVEENMLTCCTAVVRRRSIDKVAGFDDDRALMGVDDWHLWLKMSLVCSFDYVAEHLAVHVFHGDNYSLNNEKMHQAELVCLDKIEEFSKQYKQTANWKDIKYRLHVRYAYCYIYTGLFKKASEAFFAANKCKGGISTFVKGSLFKIIPAFVWSSLQNLKRKLSQ